MELESSLALAAKGAAPDASEWIGTWTNALGSRLVLERNEQSLGGKLEITIDGVSVAGDLFGYSVGTRFCLVVKWTAYQATACLSGSLEEDGTLILEWQLQKNPADLQFAAYTASTDTYTKNA